MNKLLKKMGLSDTRHQLNFKSPKRKSPATSKKKQNQSKFEDSKSNSNKGSMLQHKQSAKRQNQERSTLQSTLLSHQNTERANHKPEIFYRKKQSNNKSQPKKGKQESSRLLDKSQDKISSFQLINQKATQSCQKIQDLIRLLLSKTTKKCPLPDHQHNKISYLCLQPNCQIRFGCSYCFLHNHEKHLKSQIVTAIKDLEELSFKVNLNEKLFAKKAQQFYDQFCLKLEQQLQNIREEFQSNLNFLKTKVKSQFDAYYVQKYKEYLQHQEQTISSFEIPQILVSDLKQKDFQNTVKFQETFKGISNARQKTEEQVRQKQALLEIVNLNIEDVYQYLRKRLEILHLEAGESKILLQFFQELNSGVTQLFSAFKRNLPKIFSQPILLEKPQILSTKA